LALHTASILKGKTPRPGDLAHTKPAQFPPIDLVATEYLFAAVILSERSEPKDLLLVICVAKVQFG
jgi:hypothetical protein